MRRKGSERHGDRIARARAIAMRWMCKCYYTNVAAFRCYCCGARPPRSLRAEMRSIYRARKLPVSTDA